MRVCVLTMMIALSLCAWGCGASTDYSGGNPVTPTPDACGNPDPARWHRDGRRRQRGWRAVFSPNPATLPAGQMVVWHNVDSVTHRVVLNNGSLDRATCVRARRVRRCRSAGAAAGTTARFTVDGRHDPAEDD